MCLRAYPLSVCSASCLNVGVRICVIGNSGSGKSTLARSIAHEFGLTHVELDALFHQPNWEPTPTEQFREKVSKAQADAQHTTGGWVCDGNYLSHLADLTVGQADVIVCFQLSRARVMQQLLGRTLRRTLTREELWNGNRERFINLFNPNPHVNILRWAWTEHENYAVKFARVHAESTATWIDVRTSKQRQQVLDGVRRATT